MSQINKILVIRLSSLGDIILSFPLLKKLREKFPEAKIDYLTKDLYREVIELNPNVNEILTLKESVTDMRKVVKENNYDLILDIHKNFRSFKLSAFNGKIKRYRKDNFKKFLLVNFKIDLLQNSFPVFRKYLNTISEYLTSDDLKYTVSELLFDRGKIIEGEYIVIAPSSRHFTKTYPKEKFAEYINKLHETKKIQIVLVGDNSDRDMNICSYIRENCKNVSDLCGKLSINKLAGVLYNSSAIITNDSAILHFSEALGKDVTSIFGSTVKQFGFFPQLKDSKVLEKSDLKCRPCTHIGKDKCPKGHFRCMEEIELIVNS